MAEFKKVFTLVTEEIINQGQDSTQFLKWLGVQKPGGSQLESWSEAEMVSAIAEYKTAALGGNFMGDRVGKDLTDSEGEEDPSQNVVDWRDTSPSKAFASIGTNEHNTLKIVKVEKQKKGLFGTRLVFTILLRPEQIQVYRRRSDFEWLLVKLQEDPEFAKKKGDWQKLKDKEDVEKLLIEIQSTPGLLKSNEFLRWFLTCQDPSAIKECKKRDTSGTVPNVMVSVRDRKKSDNIFSASKPQEPTKFPDQTSAFEQQVSVATSSQKTKEAESLQEAYTTVKQNQEHLRMLKRHCEDLGFLLDQVHGKVEKIAGCFGKLGESWAKPALQNSDSLSHNPAELSSTYAQIKLLFFQWGQSLETGKTLLKKNFVDTVEKVCSELSEVKKVLKPLKDTLSTGETPKKAINGSDLGFMECVRARKVETEALGVWKVSAQLLVLGLLGHDAGARGMEQLRGF